MRVNLRTIANIMSHFVVYTVIYSTVGWERCRIRYVAIRSAHCFALAKPVSLQSAPAATLWLLHNVVYPNIGGTRSEAEYLEANVSFLNHSRPTIFCFLEKIVLLSNNISLG